MSCVEGLLLAVPTVNKEAFRRDAAPAAAVIKGHGALSVVERWGEAVPPPGQRQRDALAAKAGEGAAGTITSTLPPTQPLSCPSAHAGGPAGTLRVRCTPPGGASMVSTMVTAVTTAATAIHTAWRRDTGR
jgi:Protein of unknown function (DUF1428)